MTSLMTALVLTAALTNNAMAGAPTDQIRTTVDRVLAILKDPALTGASAKEERREELRKAIFPRFDFEEMAKRSLGAEWRRQPPAKQKEFVDLFTELLRNSYVESIESYGGSKIVYNRESQDGNYAEVGSKITAHQGEEFSIDYRLMLEGGAWKVYDVIVENISLVNNYRSQFRRILGRSSFAELLQTIRDKIR
jgi:phospholipid transport system substrate-binding protein